MSRLVWFILGGVVSLIGAGVAGAFSYSPKSAVVSDAKLGYQPLSDTDMNATVNDVEQI